MNKEILNWLPEKELFSKQKEFEIHDLIHNKTSKETRSKNQIWGGKRKIRSEALEQVLKEFNLEIRGNVLEVGAGDGWCSAYIVQHKDIISIHTMECNRSAVEKLIPKTFNLLDVELDKVNLVLGSFNYIKEENYFDSVIAMGALHHSANLHHTLGQIYKSLKPGAFLIAQEPYMSDCTKNDFYFDRESLEVNFWNVKTLKNHERTDLFYRECEYRTAAYHVGFDFRCIRLRDLSTPMSFLQKLGITKVKEDKSKPMNMIFVLTKPLKQYDQKPPTAWE